MFASRGNADPSKANFIEYIGQRSGTWTIANCAWSGSEAGIASVANETVLNSDGHPLAGSPQTWMKADGSVTGISASSPTAGEKEASSRQGDLAMADTSQAVSLTQDISLHDYGVLGIVPFVWLKNTNSVALPAETRLTGVTTFQLQNLLGAPQFASTFTGNPLDTNGVYCVGRNKGSGTRVNTLADTQYGITTDVNQFSIGGGVAFGSSQTTTLILGSEGNNGYESGGNVINALKIDGSSAQVDPFPGSYGGTPGQVGWIAIGYAGLGDAGGLPTSHWLTLNGVAESDGAVEQGTYSFWGHEHLFGVHNRTSGFQFDLGTAIAAKMWRFLRTTKPKII